MTPPTPQYVNAMERLLVTNVRSLNPSKFRLAQAGLGIEAYFPDGIGLRCRSLTAPFLSWPGGSAGPGVPVPPSKWLMISFGEAQPPVMMSFLSSKTTLKVEGRTGDWTVKSPLDYKGWVRFLLPTGHESVGTSGVQSLGQLATRVANLATFWEKPIPKLVSFRAENVAGGVNATWVFDRPGAMVPAAAHAARANGYMLEVRSPLDVMKKPIVAGVRAFSRTKELTIFFPMLPKLSGRPLGTGMIAPLLQGEAQDPPNYYRQAIQAMFLSIAPGPKKWMEDSQARLAAAGPWSRNLTNNPTRFDSKGRGYWELAYAGWFELLLTGKSDDLDQAWRGVDMAAWEPGYLAQGQNNRVAAYMALAGFSGTARDRALAGMIHAGDIARRQAGSLRVLEGVRKSLFTAKPADNLGRFWQSPIRILSGPLPTFRRTPTVLSLAFAGGTLRLSCVRRYEIVDIDGEADYTWGTAEGRAVFTVKGLAGKTTVVKLRDLRDHPLPAFPALPDYVEQIQP